MGLNWLGNASLEEYAVGLWFEQNNVTYIYQAPLDVMGNDIFIDFLLVGNGQNIAIEVQGDKWHAGLDQIADDRLRMLRAIEVRPTLNIVEVWGHSIVEEPGWFTPTDAHFNRVMQAAIQGIALIYGPVWM